MIKKLILLLFLIGSAYGMNANVEMDPDKKPSYSLIFTEKLRLNPNSNPDDFTYVKGEIFSQILSLHKFYGFHLKNESYSERLSYLLYSEDNNDLFIVLIKNKPVEEFENKIYNAFPFSCFEEKKDLEKSLYKAFPYSAYDLSLRYTDIMLHSSISLYLRGLIKIYDPVYKKIRSEGLEKAIKRILITINKDLNCSIYSVSDQNDFLSFEEFRKYFFEKYEKKDNNCNCIIF